ncbi:MAG: sigma-70 family RNA polymerase sigma factor [Gemmatimonadaceae bacterium]|nr:sigma-70 family RNA polymerase sigma factor [Gemmatimonadaceae bacterium]
MTHEREAAFPATQHSLIQRLRRGDDQGAQDAAAFDALTRAYWTPVHRYLCLRWSFQSADAEDLTQSFLASAWSRGFLSQFDPDRARFRTFMRVCLDRHVMNHQRNEQAEKREGSRVAVSLDADPSAVHAVATPSSEQELDAAFRDEFVRALYTRAVVRLEQQLAARGRAVVFEVFRRYDLEAETPARYAQIAESLDISVVQVTNHLHAARRLFRELTLDELRELCASDDEYRDEARDLLGVQVP